jgi:predicted NACHT family NTPase
MANQLQQASPESLKKTTNSSSLQQFYSQITKSIHRICNRVRVLDMAKPLDLTDVYVPMHIIRNDRNLRHIPAAQASLRDNPREHTAKINEQAEPALQILETLSKVIILGRMGSGKTMLLKYLALQCVAGKFQARRIPLLISLRELREEQPHDLLGYIATQISQYGMISLQLATQLVVQGRLLFLIDGLDDLTARDADLVLRQIHNLADRFPDNYWAIACRPKISTQILDQFTEVELAGFNHSQIEEFAHKWLPKLHKAASAQPEVFLAQLSSSDAIKEIAANPLLLTLLCTKFARCDRLSLPNAIADALNLYLYAWDAGNYRHSLAAATVSDIERQKELLSWIALSSFKRGKYLIEAPNLAQDLKDFSATQDEIPNEVLFAEARGIYEFAFTAFQEYLIADRLVNSPNPKALKFLVERIMDKQWHSVILIAFSMLTNADDLVKQMKQKIDESIVKSEKLQRFLVWVSQQVSQLQSPYKSESLRAFYLDIDLERTRALDRARALEIAHMRSLERARVKAEGKANEMDTEVDIDFALTNALNLDLVLYVSQAPILQLARSLEPSLGDLLDRLREKLPSPTKEPVKFKNWWTGYGMEWSQQLRQVIIQHRRGIQEWELSESQVKALKRYHDANKVLVECLNTNAVSAATRQEIKSTLLLPITKIEQI